MVTADGVTVDAEDDRVAIERIEFHSAEVAEFFTQFDAGDHQEVAGQALEVGVTAMELMDTFQEVEYVERRLSELQTELEGEAAEF